MLTQRVRVGLAVAAGLVAGAAMAARVVPIEPFLEVRASPALGVPGTGLWELRVTARGAETIDEIRVEPLSPSLHVLGPPAIAEMRSGTMRVFRFQSDPGTEAGRVRVIQKGRVARTYDVTLGFSP